MGKQQDFCYECRQRTPYTLKETTEKKEIGGRMVEYPWTTAICDICGAEMNPPHLFDANMGRLGNICCELGIQFRLTENEVRCAESEFSSCEKN